MTGFEYSFFVRFSDVDHAGIVYYPKFLHYCHVAFEEYMRTKLGPSGYADMISDRRIGFPTVSITSQFTKPLAFGDNAVVRMYVKRVGHSSVTLSYRIENIKKEEEILAATCEVICVCTNLDLQKSCEIPKDLRNALFF